MMRKRVRGAKPLPRCPECGGEMRWARMAVRAPSQPVCDFCREGHSMIRDRIKRDEAQAREARQA